MNTPELLSPGAGETASRLIDEMSRLYYLSRAIHVAAELGIADHLDDGAVSLDTLADKTETNVAALRRLLRFLSAYGIFEELTEGKFQNTALSSVLSSDHPQSVRANLQRIGAFWWSAVGDLEYSIRTGEPAFENVHGMSFFPFLKENADVQRRFDRAMAKISDADDAAIASAYDFRRFDRIIDLGGGRGGLLVQILERAPEATGILFEQPQVLEKANRLDEAGLSDRTETIAGDFFTSVPEDIDCYVIKGVLHDFNDQKCIQILANCRRAASPTSHLVIANQDLPSTIDSPHPNLTMDIQMMTLLGGRERTAADWSSLFQQSGWSYSGQIETAAGFTIVEGKVDPDRTPV